MLACAAFTSDDLPMPRAPQSSALLAGRPVGEAFGVLDQDVAHPVDALEQRELDPADPRHRLEPSVRVPDEGVGVVEGAAAGRGGRGRGQMRRDGLERAGDPRRRIVRRRSVWAFCRDFRVPFGGAALGVAREAVFAGFFDMLQVPDGAAISGLSGAPQAGRNEDDRSSVAIGTAAAIVRANLPGPACAREAARRSIPVSRGLIPMLITPAYAQAAAGGDTNSMLMSLLPFALIFVIMYFLILRPQQKKVKDHAELVKNIRRGDTVVTSGGLVGKVTKVVDDDQIEFEISDGVRVRQMRQMISGVRAKGEPAKERPTSPRTRQAADDAEAPYSRVSQRRICLRSDGSTRCCISRGGRRWGSS